MNLKEQMIEIEINGVTYNVGDYIYLEREGSNNDSDPPFSYGSRYTQKLVAYISGFKGSFEYVHDFKLKKDLFVIEPNRVLIEGVYDLNGKRQSLESILSGAIKNKITEKDYLKMIGEDD